MNNGSIRSIEFRLFSFEWSSALKDFFKALDENGDTSYFHPHPFTDEFLDKLSNYKGNDLYYIAAEANIVLAYGMLRGWDDGYIIPSLGIAIHPMARGLGLSKVFMHFLHFAAHRKGATQIRLKVYPDNLRAIRLYENFGYTFEGMENNQLVGRFIFT